MHTRRTLVAEFLRTALQFPPNSRFYLRLTNGVMVP